jgi:hypothetical protein
MKTKTLIPLILALFLTIAFAASRTITFEGLRSAAPGSSDPVHVTDQYLSKGVVFGGSNLVALDYSTVQDSRYAGFAHSGSKTLELCYGIEFCGIPLRMNFTTPVKRLRLWVGFSTNRNPVQVRLRGFDANNKINEATVNVRAPHVTPTSPNGELKVTYRIENYLEITGTTFRIKRAELTVVNKDSSKIVENNNLNVDDIEFE